MPPSGQGETVAVKLARIEERQEGLITAVQSLTQEVKQANGCNQDLAVRTTAIETTVKTHGEEIQKLRARDTTNNILTAALAAIAAGIGALVKGP